jgi:excisionase family DNA binding protein
MPHDQITPRLLTKEDVAEVLGVSTRHVTRLLAEQRLACIRLGHRSVRISEDALAAYIGAHTQPAINRVPRRRRAA